MARNYSDEEVCETPDPSKSVFEEASARVNEMRSDARDRYEGHLREAKRLEVLATEHRQAAQAWQTVFEPGPVDPISPMRDDDAQAEGPNLKRSW